MQQKYWWKLQKGMGIRVKIIDDTDKETGKQKYRPAIVVKSYPSHVKVQLMTTEPSNHDFGWVTLYWINLLCSFL